MQNSSCETLTIQAQGSETPTTLAKAAHVPLRVAINNVGATLCMLAFTTTDLTPNLTTAIYKLPPTKDTVFVLAPKQSLYAISIGIGGQLSTTVSEALPRD